MGDTVTYSGVVKVYGRRTWRTLWLRRKDYELPYTAIRHYNHMTGTWDIQYAEFVGGAGE